MEKVVVVSESLFQPVNGMQSTHSLVEIHNIESVMWNSLNYAPRFAAKMPLTNGSIDKKENSFI